MAVKEEATGALLNVMQFGKHLAPLYNAINMLILQVTHRASASIILGVFIPYLKQEETVSSIQLQKHATTLWHNSPL